MGANGCIAVSVWPARADQVITLSFSLSFSAASGQQRQCESSETRDSLFGEPRSVQVCAYVLLL